jgi:hypothetical protein
MRTVIIALLPLALACETQTNVLNENTTPDTDPVIDTPDCDGMARVLSPASDGQSDFYFRDDIAFEINQGEEEAEITLADAQGEPVPGTTWLDVVVLTEGWTRLVFTPDGPLAPSTGHTATLSYCGGSPTVDFSTSALGTPVHSPEVISGRTYEINLSAARVTQPSQVAQALLSLVDHSLMVFVDHADLNGLDLTIAAADKITGIQDTCIPTLNMEVEGDLSGPPTFSVGPVDFEFDLAGYGVTLFDATIDATFAADGSYFAGGHLSGTLDARDIVDALAGRDVLPIEDADAICEVISQVGLECTPCADGAVLCLNIEVEQIKGELTEHPIEVVSDFDCHEGCEDACENEECTTADQFEVCL